jgi:hypothetical protein
MKSLIAATILAFTITHASAQSLTCRPVGPNVVCAPTPPPSSAGIGPALLVVVGLYFLIQYLKADKQEQPNQP